MPFIYPRTPSPRPRPRTPQTPVQRPTRTAAPATDSISTGSTLGSTLDRAPHPTRGHFSPLRFDGSPDLWDRGGDGRGLLPAIELNSERTNVARLLFEDAHDAGVPPTARGTSDVFGLVQRIPPQGTTAQAYVTGLGIANLTEELSAATVTLASDAPSAATEHARAPTPALRDGAQRAFLAESDLSAQPSEHELRRAYAQPHGERYSDILGSPERNEAFDRTHARRPNPLSAALLTPSPQFKCGR